MTTLITVVLLCFVFSWLISFNCKSPWAFALWFPLTATSVIGALAWILVIPDLGNHGAGAAEGFAALGAAIAFLYLLVFPVVFVISLIFRPRVKTSARIIVVTVVGYILVAGGLALCASEEHERIHKSIPLNLTIVDSQGDPVWGASVTYKTRQCKDGFASSEQEGAVFTDNYGYATVFTRKTHGINVVIHKDGFENTVFYMDCDWGFSRHQARVSWSTEFIDQRGRRDLSSHQVTFDIPTSDPVNLKLMIPRKGEGKLPYPTQQP